MPISLEQWRAAVGRWVARIQRTLIIRRGVKRSPPCASNQERESPSGQSHSGERKCMGRRKGRKKYKEDPVNDPAIASDEFYEGVIVLAVPLMSCGTTVSKDCSDGNPAGSLKELFSWTALYAFLVMMLLLLRSGDVEPNPGPAERGAHTLLSISSTPTLHELDKLTVSHAASQWEAVAPHLVVESCGICKVGSGHLEEASRGALSRWLKDKSDTDIAEKTRCSVLEAHEANGSIHIAEQLKLFEESSGEAVTDLASPPGVFGTGRRHQYMSPTTTAGPHVRGHPPGDLAHGSVHTPFGSNEIHGPDGKIAQQGAHTLLSISSTPTLHELGKLTVCHAASQWEVVAPHLVVESCGVCKFGSGHLQEASRGTLSRWLKSESDTDIAEKTRCSVLEAQEANGNIMLAEQLKLFEESSGEPVTGLAASPPDPMRLSCHLSCDLINELPNFELNVDYLFYHFGEWMKAGPTRSDLSCPLSDELTMDLERRGHTKGEKKQRRLRNLRKRHANRRIGKCKVVRNLTTAFNTASPYDSAVGSSIEPHSSIDYESENNTDHDLSCGNQLHEIYNEPPLEPPIKDDGLPTNPVWEIARKETNAIKLKYWAEKRERLKRFGHGFEAAIHHAINTPETPCEYEAAAETIIEKKLGPVERYAVHAYIGELKKRESSAVDFSRIYRDKMEKCQLEQKQKAVEMKIKQQEQREFYRNSIQEGRSRAGRILRMAMTKK